MAVLAPAPNFGALMWFTNSGPMADIPTVHEPIDGFDDYSATESTHNNQVIERVKFLNNFRVKHLGVRIIDSNENGKNITTDESLSCSVQYEWCWLRAPNGNDGKATGGTNTTMIRCEIAGYPDGTMHKYGFFNAVECLFHSPLDTYHSYFAGKPLPNSHPDPIQQITNTNNQALAPRFLIERCGFYAWPWHDKRTSGSQPINVDGVPLKTAANNPSYWRATAANDALSSTSMIGLFKIEGGSVGSDYIVIRDSYAEGRAGNGIYLQSNTSARNQGVAIFDLQVSKLYHPWAGSADGQGYCQTRWLSISSGHTFHYGRVVDAQTGAAIAPSGYSHTPAGPGSNYKSWFDDHPEIDPNRIGWGGSAPGGEGGGGGGGEDPTVTITNPTSGSTHTAPFVFSATTPTPANFIYGHLYVRPKGTTTWIYLDRDQPDNISFSFGTVSADGMTVTDRDGIVHNFAAGEFEFRAEFEQSNGTKYLATTTATVGSVVAPGSQMAAVGTLDISLAVDVTITEPSGYIDPRQVRWVRKRATRPDYDEYPINGPSGKRVVHDGVGYKEVT